MEQCPICHRPVEDSPPNIPIHAECWVAEIEKARDRQRRAKHEWEHEYDEG